MPPVSVGSSRHDKPVEPSGPQQPASHPAALSFVHASQLSGLLDEARRHPHGLSRSDLAESLTMGRNAVDRRLRTAVDLGLVVPAGHGASTGGRAPALWRFNPEAATLLALQISYRRSTAALMTLDGQALERREWDSGLLTAPQEVTAQATQYLDELRRCRRDLPAPWALGASVPIPVDFRDGSLVDPATSSEMSPSWTSPPFPLRTQLAQHLGLPVWLEDEVKAMALAASTRVGAPPDLLYVRLSLGLGMGIVSGGQVHRGAGASPGEIAHIQVGGSGGRKCRCGRHGCLETVVSGGAMEEAASTSEALRSSRFLRQRAAQQDGHISTTDIFTGVAQQDRVCLRIATEAADRLAGVLAVLSTTYNPGEIVIGGTSSVSGSFFARTISQAIRRRVLPVTSQRLRVRAGDGDDALTGVARLVTERLLSPHLLHVWLPHGTPAGVRELVEHRRQDA